MVGKQLVKAERQMKDGECTHIDIAQLRAEFDAKIEEKKKEIKNELAAERNMCKVLEAEFAALRKELEDAEEKRQFLRLLGDTAGIMYKEMMRQLRSEHLADWAYTMKTVMARVDEDPAYRQCVQAQVCTPFQVSVRVQLPCLEVWLLLLQFPQFCQSVFLILPCAVQQHAQYTSSHSNRCSRRM